MLYNDIFRGLGFLGAVRLGVAFWSEDGDFEKQLKSKFVSDRICLSFVEQSDLELPFGQKMAILKAAEVPPLTPTLLLPHTQEDTCLLRPIDMYMNLENVQQEGKTWVEVLAAVLFGVALSSCCTTAFSEV